MTMELNEIAMRLKEILKVMEEIRDLLKSAPVVEEKVEE